jgi:hypothetical protein
MKTREWIPTSTELPPRFTTVLLWMKRGRMGDNEELTVAWEDWHEVTEEPGEFIAWMIPGTPQTDVS